MKTISTIFAASLLAFSLAGAGCAASTATDPAVQSAQGALTTAPVGVQTHGPVKAIGEALGDVPLRADQRVELEKLAADAETRHQSIAQSRKDLAEAIAAQVEAGTLDRTALQPKIDAVAAAWAQVQDADRAAFERVHAILDATQRAKLADTLKAKAHAGPFAMFKGHGEGAEHGHGMGMGMGMKGFAKDLNLTDAQKDQLKAAFQEKMKAHGGPAAMHQEMKAHHEQGAKVMEAFRGEHFVLNEVAPKRDPKVMASKMSDRVLGMAEVALPILTPEQRTVAAKKIREHGAAHPMMQMAPSAL